MTAELSWVIAKHYLQPENTPSLSDVKEIDLSALPDKLNDAQTNRERKTPDLRPVIFYAQLCCPNKSMSIKMSVDWQLNAENKKPEHVRWLFFGRSHPAKKNRHNLGSN